MTTPGEELPDEQKPAPKANDYIEGMEGGNHYWWIPKGLAAIGLAATAFVLYGGYEAISDHHSAAKKPAESAPDSPYPNTTFMSNLNLTVLPYITDKAGPLPDTSFNFVTVRADEVDSSAICKTPENKYVSEPVKTIVVYKSNAPKKGFKQVWPSLGEQTALADVMLYSHEFPGRFRDGGRIGTPKAERLATEVKQDLCVEEGAFIGFKDQSIKQLLPESESISDTTTGSIDITPKNVAYFGLFALFIAEAGLLAGSRSDDKELSTTCSDVLRFQGKLLLKGPAKLRDRLQGEDENDDETISLPEEYTELVTQDELDGPHQDWGVLGRKQDV